MNPSLHERLAEECHRYHRLTVTNARQEVRFSEESREAEAYVPVYRLANHVLTPVIQARNEDKL